MKVLVCGGRRFIDETVLFNKLDNLHRETPFTGIVEGGAKGADTLAKKWADSRRIGCQEFPADWNRYGKGAGHIRNKQMLDEGKPDLVVAFPGGKGTANMVKLAKEAGVEVIEVEEQLQGGPEPQYD